MAGSGTSGPVTWARVPDLSGASATRNQVLGAKRFNGGEGCYYANDTCWFTTKGYNRVWRYDAAAQTLELAYDGSLVTSGTPPSPGWTTSRAPPRATPSSPRTAAPWRSASSPPTTWWPPFLRVDGQSASEITGPAFSPDGTRLYFSSQRGTSGSSSGGITYEVKGPFRS